MQHVPFLLLSFLLCFSVSCQKTGPRNPDTQPGNFVLELTIANIHQLYRQGDLTAVLCL